MGRLRRPRSCRRRRDDDAGLEAHDDVAQAEGMSGADLSCKPAIVHEAPPVEPQPISGERYLSPAWLAKEEAALWPKVWLFACLEQAVVEPGQFSVFNLGRESIVVARTAEGEVAAFYNTCQHRGARVATVPSGCVKSFVCPYHGWTYRTDGRLVVVPDNQRFPGGVDRNERSMPRVRVETFAGLVWICMDPDGPSLREYLGPVAERLEPYRVERMTLTGDQTVHLDCNWKAVYDNFGELYHVEHIHPQHAMLFDCPTAQVELFGRGHTGISIIGHTVNQRLPIPDEPNFYQKIQLEKFGGDADSYVGRVLDIRKDIQKLRREAGPELGWDYREMTDERLSDIEQYNVFPNIMFTVQPDDALVMRARPHPTDPNKCFWDKLTFRRQPDPAVAVAAGVEFTPYSQKDLEHVPRPEHDEFDQDEVIAGRKTMNITVDQDVHLIRDVQAGMHSRGFTTQVLSDEEVRIQHYHDWLDHTMGVR